MINLSIWDHAFAVAVFVVFPIYSTFTIRRVLDDIRERGEPALISTYQQVILSWFLFSMYVLVMWWLLDRSWGDLGIRDAELSRIAAGLAVAAIVVTLVVFPIRKLSLSERCNEEPNLGLEDIVVFMPRTHLEERWFAGVSVNAGLSEELIFRGYLLWYLQHFVGLAWAAGIAIAIFGLAHAYQGAKTLPGILLVSAVAMFLYVYTGSLLVPILFHVTLDAVQGYYIAKIRRLQVELSPLGGGTSEHS